MTKYTYDGSTIEADSPRDLVSAMHKQSEAPAKTDRDWMDQVSRRLQVQFGRKIDPSSPGAFVDGLIDIGVLKVTEE